MKRMTIILMVLCIALAAVSAGDLKFGVKGIAGVDKSGNKGPLMGGGVDVDYSLTDYVSVRMEANACGANITIDNGLGVKDNLYISVPVELCANYTIKRFDVGAGLGLATTFRDSSISVDLCGSANVTYWISDFGITFGCSGVLDCFPTLKAEETGAGSRTYSFQKSDGKDNSLLASIGVSYRFDPKAN